MEYRVTTYLGEHSKEEVFEGTPEEILQVASALRLEQITVHGAPSGIQNPKGVLGEPYSVGTGSRFYSGQEIKELDAYMTKNFFREINDGFLRGNRQHQTIMELLGRLKRAPAQEGKKECEHRGSTDANCKNVTADNKIAFISVKCWACDTVLWQGNVYLQPNDDD